MRFIPIILAFGIFCGCGREAPEPGEVRHLITIENPMLEAAIKQTKERAMEMNEANDALEVAMREHQRLFDEAKAARDTDRLLAIDAMNSEYDRRKNVHGYHAAATWWRDQVDGKTLADIQPIK